MSNMNTHTGAGRNEAKVEMERDIFGVGGIRKLGRQKGKKRQREKARNRWMRINYTWSNEA